MKSLFFLIALLFFSSAPIWATKKTSLSNSGQGWSVNGNWNPGNAPINGDSVIIPAGKTITIKTNIYNTSPVLYIVVYGTLDFVPGGKLVLGTGSTVSIMTGGLITSTGSSSEIISINGVVKYNAGSTTTIAGPAYADQYSGTSPNGFNPGILKVNLLSITTAYINQNVLTVSWTSVGETSSNYYNVEISTDKMNWSAVYKQPSLYNNLDQGNYTIKINQSNISTTTFIRVKEVDLNGELTFSETVAVKSQTENSGSLNAYPIPASSNLTLSWQLPTEKSLFNLKIFTILGNPIVKKAISSNTNSYNLNVQNFRKGWYCVVISNDDGFSITKAFLIQ